MPATYYHGTAAELHVGDRILPPNTTGTISEKGRKKNLHRVFVTTDERSAHIYAGRAANSIGGTPKVFVVHPNTPPVTLNATPGTTVLHTCGARIIGQA